MIPRYGPPVAEYGSLDEQGLPADVAGGGGHGAGVVLEGTRLLLFNRDRAVKTQWAMRRWGRQPVRPRIAWNGDAFVVSSSSTILHMRPDASIAEQLVLPSPAINSAIAPVGPRAALVLYEQAQERGGVRRLYARLVTFTPHRRAARH